MTVHVIIPGKPMVWSRPRANARGSHVIMFDPKASERKKLGLWLKQFFPAPLEGAIKIELHFFYATAKKKQRGEFKTTKSDLDNLCKSLFDAMNTIAYIDDGQICSLTCSKRWGERDETHVFVSSLSS